jgi:hydrogenase nickel incorporation protein HypA/HybF
MHEWALAEAVVNAAVEFSDKEGLKKVTEVTVKVGELQDVDRKIFRFALLQLVPDKLKGAKFHLVVAKAKLSCHVCGNSWLFRKDEYDDDVSEAMHFVPEMAHTYIKCPKCGSPDFEIAEGRGVWLESIKGAK